MTEPLGVRVTYTIKCVRQEEDTQDLGQKKQSNSFMQNDIKAPLASCTLTRTINLSLKSGFSANLYKQNSRSTENVHSRKTRMQQKKSEEVYSNMATRCTPQAGARPSRKVAFASGSTSSLQH